MRPIELGQEPTPAPELDAYRDARGVLRAEGDLVGHVMTRVQVWWRLEGRGRRRRAVDPSERLEWLVEYARSESRDYSDGYDDRVADDTPALLDLWNHGKFLLPSGKLVSVEWLTGAASDEFRESLSWPRDIADSSQGSGL